MMRYTCGACRRGMHDHCSGRSSPPPGMLGGSECICIGDCGPEHPAPEDRALLDALQPREPGDVAPRVAVKSHLDGDPKPRPDEIIEWDLMRRTHGLAEMLCLIVLPDESVTDGPFPGYQVHGWSIHERDGKVVCEPSTIEIVVT